MSDLIFFAVLFLFLIGALTAFIWAFIRSKEFRDDLLKHDSDNEITLGPLSLKGVLFLALIGLFVAATSYMFSRFLEETDPYDFTAIDASNDDLIQKNNALIDENGALRAHVEKLKDEVAKLKLASLKRDAIMDIYRNTKLLAYDSALAVSNKTENNKIKVLSARLGTLSDMANGVGENITGVFERQCNNRTVCSVSRKEIPEIIEHNSKLVIEYMCSKLYQIASFEANEETLKEVVLECVST